MKIQQIAEQAISYPEMVFRSLAHHIDVEMLAEAYKRTNKQAASGIDRVTAEEYAEDLEGNLRDLHNRLKTGRYRAMPIERVWLDKEDGSKRPIGKPVFEDKIVQRAVVMLLEAVYEKDFYDFSYGGRRGRSAHQALLELREQCMKLNINWIVDADITGFFDNINRKKLIEILRLRVNDGGIIRLIGKWFNAGVIDGGTLSYPEKGTPQGGVISPILANIFLHHVLDEWIVRKVQPRLKGRCFIIRFVDDFVIGCEYEADAKGLMEVLPKRFALYDLAIHPTKTKMVRFGKPKSDRAPETETFDFLGFTHYWDKSRRRYWVIKRHTASKRLRRAMKAFWEWCRENNHEPVREQFRRLSMKLRGYYQYYSIRGNYKKLEVVMEYVQKTWYYWLKRRSSTRKFSAALKERLQQDFVLPKPRILHAI
jgi:group II intron reverse transcriptase/maturase